MNTSKTYYDSDENECSLIQLVKREPYWAAARIQEGEKAIEELAKIKTASKPAVEADADVGGQSDQRLAEAEAEKRYGSQRNYKQEAITFRRMLWLNHGHTGMYGDDGEMQCAECLREYGFWDWKLTPAAEIESRIGR